MQESETKTSQTTKSMNSKGSSQNGQKGVKTLRKGAPSQRLDQLDKYGISMAELPGSKTTRNELKREEQQRLQRDIIGVLITNFCWEVDLDSFSRDILQVSQERRSIFLKEDDYFFRTFFGSVGLTEGIHYWEIIADASTDHELKIGVSKSRQCDQKTAFCDYEFGWAFFGVGQLRHNSNAQGAPYGKVFKRQGVLGVFLNMNKGTLSFSIDGQYCGVAFEDTNLKSGPIYPAISVLHKAGCTLVSGKHPPVFFFD